MLHALMNLLSSCFRPFGRRHSEDRVDSVNGNGFGGKEGLLWFRDLGKYGSGDFSMAVVQANQVLEDQSQIENGPFGTFVGVYDGHGGPDAARYVCDHLFPHFQGQRLVYFRILRQLGEEKKNDCLAMLVVLFVVILFCGF